MLVGVLCHFPLRARRVRVGCNKQALELLQREVRICAEEEDGGPEEKDANQGEGGSGGGLRGKTRYWRTHVGQGQRAVSLNDDR